MAEQIIPYDDAVRPLNAHFVGKQLIPPGKRKLRTITTVTLESIWSDDGTGAIRLYFDNATSHCFEMGESAATT